MKDWSWNPDKADKYISTQTLKRKAKARKKKKRARKTTVTKGSNDKFYKSKEWREIRVRVLEKYECKCMMCGRSPKLHGVVLNVDHIKPRRKYPELSLVFENLQVLCGACNHGKLNKYQTDYRPDTEDALNEVNEMLDNELIKSSPF